MLDPATPFIRLKCAATKVIGPLGMAAWSLLLLNIPVHGSRTGSLPPDAWHLLPMGHERFAAAQLPGGYAGIIDAHGFALHNTTTGAHARVDVLNAGRTALPGWPWQAGPAEHTANEVLYPGTTMAVQYQQTMLGLRQNFIVQTRPDGAGELAVELALSGNLHPRLEEAARVHFIGPSGRTAFTYDDLRCWDADGRSLDARFELTDRGLEHRLRILVDDREARYPVTIDPVSTTPNTLLVGTHIGAEFGYSVATAGDLNGDGRSDVAVGAWLQTVGAASQAGAVHVYYGTNAGIGTTASITLSIGQQGARFGNAVSTAGDVNGDGFSDLLVGARTWESNTTTELSEGAVFVYYGSPTGINPTADLVLQPDHAQDNFGSNLACAGDINNDGFSDVIVGAYLASYPAGNEGAVFIYLGSASGLSPVPLHRLERNQAGSFFGRSVAGAGDINGDGFSDVIIGASKWANGGLDQGSAFVYYGSSSGLGSGFNPAPGLQLFGTGNNSAYYGWWVTCAGDLNGDGFSDVAVSAYMDEIGPQTDEGLIHVYRGSAAGLVTAPVAVLQSDQSNAWMGRCVSTAGDVNGDGYGDLLVGSTRYTGPEGLEGRAQIFLGSPTGVPTSSAFNLELNSPGANLGESVSPAGDVNGDGYADFLVGARIYGSGGAAVVYHGGPYGTSPVPTSSRSGGMTGALLGSSSANAGDVNGDGYADALVGAPGASNGEPNEGLAYIYYGSFSGLSVLPSALLEENSANARFGASVASAGDVNGDGYADVLVGAPGNGAGKVFLYLGSSSGLNFPYAAVLSAGSLFGSSVAPAGDVNHDGYADVVIGSPGTGEAYIHHGGPAGLGSVPTTVLAELPATSMFGCSVATAGDVNGDGFSDVIVGASNGVHGQANEGLAYIYHGSFAGIPSTHAQRLEADQVGAAFGTSVAGAGDVNGDGFSDVVVGADAWESGQLDEGAVFVFHGSFAGISATPAIVLQRDIGGGALGRSVAEAGDVNGDGYADIIVGAPLAESTLATPDEGLAYVFRGSPGGISATNPEQLDMNGSGYHLGTSVSGAGDVDGDGYSDVYAGAPNADPVSTNEGTHSWFRGGLDRALNRLTRQYAADLVSPISTNSQDFVNSNLFGIGHRARSPIQRCRARLRWEVVFEGAPFSGSPITSSVGHSGIGAAWTSLPLAGVEIKQLVVKPMGYMRFKWRVRAEYDPAKLIDGQRFSRWFYGFAGSVGDIGVLPIELLAFGGRANGPVNDLFWTTASEQHGDRFDVLRSTDAVAFTSTGSVPAAGESQAMLDYAFTDPFPPRGTSYYQLRMVDIDGAEAFTEVVAISRDQGLVALFPNPADDAVLVVVGEQLPGAMLLLIDAEGRQLHALSLTDRDPMPAIDLRGLAAGTYTVMMRDGAGAVIGALPLVKH